MSAYSAKKNSRRASLTFFIFMSMLPKHLTDEIEEKKTFLVLQNFTVKEQKSHNHSVLGNQRHPLLKDESCPSDIHQN